MAVEFQLSAISTKESPVNPGTFDFLCAPPAVFETQPNGLTVVRNFGDPSVEHTAVTAAAVVIPMPLLIRLRVTGRDRIRFLHNFCTNNVRDLQPGDCCETFFTDSRARILAHGWVLAGSSHHDIWMLPGDCDSLQKHLNRYIIAEDVVIDSGRGPSVAFAVAGPDASARIADGFCGTSEGASIVPSDRRWGDVGPMKEDPCAGHLIDLHLTMAGIPVHLLVHAADIAEGAEASSSLVLKSVWFRLLESGCVPAGVTILERLRILERIPLVGTDISSDNLAPEADRNTSAISYTKGCYLGQEPIARLDAMGHVNRALRTLRISAPVSALRDQKVTVELAGTGVIGELTSANADWSPEASVGLAIIRVHGTILTTGVTVHAADGSTYLAEVLPV